jgi:excisionase family DNA binding protein
MAKKYLTLEEAAAKLNMTTDELKKLREQGEIRGFADRASWKFRDEDVENYARAMNPNSAASIPAYDDDDQLPITAEEEPSLDDSASDVRLILDDDLLAPGLGEEDTRKHEPPPQQEEVSPDSAIHLGESDEDITAATDDTMKAQKTPDTPDSAITLGESDADIAVAGDDETLKMSDSEKRASEGEGSSIRSEGSSIRSEGSSVRSGETEAEPEPEPADSGISLTLEDESEQGVENITYEAAQSEIGLEPAGSEGESDSDVRLADQLQEAATGSGVDLDDAEGSNIRLDEMEEHPDSGINLTAGSDVMQAGEEITLESVSSDVEDTSLADSDVKLVDNDSNVLMEAQDDDEGVTLAAGSSIISGEEDSGISLEAADSGISLEAADSGISLESLDSGINLTDETTEVDFGLGPDDSGITLESDEEAEKTVTMESTGGAEDADDFNDTAFEIDAEGAGSSEYEISGLEDNEEEDDTSVLLLDDDDESDAASATLIGAQADDFEEEDAFDLGDEMVDEFGDSDLLVEETVVGDDDELDDLDVFDAVDEDFEDDFGEMSSAGEFAAPVGMRMAAPPEAEMGTGIFVGVLLSSVMMAACCLIMIDLTRTMWSYEQPGWYSSTLLDMIKSFF